MKYKVKVVELYREDEDKYDREREIYEQVFDSVENSGKIKKIVAAINDLDV